MARIRAALCLLLLLACCGCADRTELVNRTSMDFMDTVSTLTLPASQASAAEQVFALCIELDSRWSARRPDSEIGRLNAAQGARVPLSQDTLEMLEQGLQCAALTGGLMDITIAPVSLLWDFKAQDPALPDPDRLADALALVGIDGLTLGEGWASLPPGAGVDVGALAKGAALDQSVDLLRRLGVETGIVNLGGSVYALGRKPDGGAWHVAVQRPFGGQGGYAGVVSVSNLCVVTAGVYERGFWSDGTYYHHLLDPRTGMPFETELAGATILYERGMVADAFSTICMLLGAQEALALVEATPGMECILVGHDGSLTMSSGIGTAIPFRETAP